MICDFSKRAVLPHRIAVVCCSPNSSSARTSSMYWRNFNDAWLIFLQILFVLAAVSRHAVSISICATGIRT